MEIYHFEYGVFLNVVCVLMAIGMAIAAAFAIKLVIQQIKKEAKNGAKIQVKRILELVPFIIIPLVLSVVFGILFAKYTAFDYNMSKGNVSFLKGDVAVVSCEEEYYRGRFSGYIVVIEVDGQRIFPSNVFPEDVVEAFESDQTLIIQYGEVKNDDTIIWSIKVPE